MVDYLITGFSDMIGNILEALFSFLWYLVPYWWLMMGILMVISIVVLYLKFSQRMIRFLGDMMRGDLR
jgi:hypothetical protein